MMGFLKNKESRRKLEKVKEFILDLFFPKFCIGCGKEGKYVCTKCQVFLSDVLPICPVCGKPSFQGEVHIQCKRKYSIDGLTALWDYDGLAKKLIYEAKIGRYFNIFSENIENFFESVLSDSDRFSSFLSFLKSEHICISYVPMLKKEKRKRGFNQAEIIAQEISKFMNIRIISLLEKKKKTKDQTILNKEERFENVKGAFNVKKDCQKIENVLLVDDIFTSGATIKECANTLKKAGIKKVWGFVIAKA